jgi:hypothetical protein
MESEENFCVPNISEKFHTEDGETITLEELGNGFLEMMKGSHKIMELPREQVEQKIKFLIQVYLVDKKLFSRTELNNKKATNLINYLYEFFISQPAPKENKDEPTFPRELTKSMVRQARLQQLGEKGHAHLCEEGERDIYGQTVKEFDESRNK